MSRHLPHSFLFFFCFLLVNSSLAADRFWVGGSGDWNDMNHWSAVSGGASGVAVPGPNDNAIFDTGSGLIPTSIVNINVAVDITDLDFSTVATTFTFNANGLPFSLRGSLAGNVSGVAFTGVWPAIDMNTTLAGETISSGGTIWVQDFITNGELISLTDDFTNGTGVFQVDSGGVNLGGHNLTCGEFLSASVGTRTIDISNSTINVNLGLWTIDSTNLTWTATSSEILFGDNAGVGTFTGGSLPYDLFRSTSANSLTYIGNNSFGLFELVPSSNFKINSGDTLSTDSLIASGSCISRLFISTIGGGQSGYIKKTGFNSVSLSGLDITNVDAVAPSTYSISFSALQNATGWDLDPSKFFWIGDGGDWNDVNHWSFSSGGPVAGCLPYISDSVFFDVNSFSVTGQEVVVDDTAFFRAMHWDNIFGNQTLSLDSSIWAYGDVVFHPNLTVIRNTIVSGIQFNDQADLFPNSAAIDASISLIMPSPAVSLNLQGDLVMSDTSSVILFNGKFATLNHHLKTGTFFTANDPATAVDNREVDFGSSTIELVSQFSSLGDTSIVFDAGTSHLFIGDTLSFDNALVTEGLTFHDVTLNFTPLNIGPFPLLQSVRGSNTFNKFEIIKGSHVYLQAGTTQTVNDSLIMQGNCQDSIWLRSLDTTTNVQAIINKSVSTDVLSECVNIGGINYANPSAITFFSTNLGNNNNWIFSSVPPTAANFTFTGANGSLCFGDTVFFNNTSTAFSGNQNDLFMQWSFNDDTLGFVPDTNAHIFNGSGDFNVTLQTEYTNFCTDEITQVVTVNEPIVFLSTQEFDLEICSGEPVEFEASSPIAGTEFEFFINGNSVLGPGVNDTLFTTVTLADGDTVSAQSYANGCVSDSVPELIFTVNPLPTFTMVSSDSDTTICAGDFVSFTGVGGAATDLFQYQVNGTNVTSLTADSTYSTSTLANNDVVTLTSQSTDGCADSASMTFTVDALPTTSLTSTELGTIICQGTNVTFTASGATTYEFFVNGASQGAASATTTFSTSSLTASDTVSVIGYLANGCSFEAPQSFSYSIIATPNITLTSSDSDTTICSGETVNFSASGGADYEFFVDGISQGPPTPVSNFSTSGLTNGQVVHVVGTLGGCPGVSSSYTFTVLPSPATVLSSTDVDHIICQSETVTFTGSGATNYEFFIDGVSQGAPSTVNTLTTSTLINGQTIVVSGESNGCVTQDQLTYTVLSTPSISLFSDDADNTICDAEPITFTTGNGASYQLFVNGSPFGAPQTASTFINPALPVGTNAVFVEGTGANGCTSTSLPALSVTVNPIPTVTMTSSDIDDIICAGESVTFTGSGSNQYQFFINGVAQTTLSSNATFTTTSLTNGVNVEILGSSLGCTASSNVINMTVNPVPVVTMTNTDPNNIWCENEVVTFEGNGATNYEFFVNGASQGVSSPTNTLNSTSFPSGSYSVQVIGEQNNCFASASIGVTVNPLPVPTLASSDGDDIICAGESVTYTAGGGATYEFFIDGVSQGISSAINTFTTTSLVDGNVVSVVVTSSGGCTESALGGAMTVNPIPTLSLVSSDPTNEICIGESVSFTASGATDYEFFVNGVSQGVPSTTSTFTTTSLQNSDVVTVSGASFGCASSSVPQSFIVYDYPVVSLLNNGDIQICAGELTDLEASGAATYQFLVNGSPVGPFSATTTLNTSLTNGDVITVSGELNGCAALSADTYTFTVFDFPTIATTSSATNSIICQDELVSFTASGAMAYDFLLNGALQQTGASASFDINTLADGDVVSIIGYNGDCPSTPDTYTFTVNSMNLQLSASLSNMICEGETVTFTATGGDNYEFFLNGTSTGAMSPTNTFTSSTLSDLDEVTFTATNNSTGCTQDLNDVIIMNVIDQPFVTALSATDFCEGDSVILVSPVSFGNQWYLNGAPIAGATDTSYVAFTSGVYSLEVASGGNGAVWSFGQNASGALGNGLNFNSADPVPASTSEAFDELTSGYEFVLGVTTAGELYAWGDNSAGQLGDGTFTSTNQPQIVPTLSNIKTAATSEASSMAVTNGGEVYVWGDNFQGQLATGNTSVINFPFLNTALTNVDSIAGGRNHFVILKTDGTVWTVGNNDYGQLGQGNLTPSLVAVQVPGLATIQSVGAGEYHSFAIDANGDLFVWGNNGSGQLGLGDLTNRLDPTVSGLKNIVNAQGGASHSAFLSSQNKVYTAGANGFGQLGSSTFTPSTSPLEVNVSGAVRISTGEYTTLVQRLDNTVFGFGNNTEDQLSSLAGTSVSTPEHVQDLDGVGFIEAGRYTSHFISTEEKVCTSPGTTVNMLATPPVTISVSGDVLTATAGASYQWYLAGSIIPGATDQTYLVTATGDYQVEVTFANGCSAISAVHTHNMADVQIQTWEAITLYPNPASEMVNLSFENALLENTNYQIIDQAGRTVLTDRVTGTNMSIDVSNLEDGMYQLVLSNGSAMKVMRFAKTTAWK